MNWTDNIEVINDDCMFYLKDFPDNHFDLAIIDPPYGINIGKQGLGEGGGTYRKPKKYKRGDWDSSSPEWEYFHEVRRVSKNQIIWGANHFISKIPFNSSCWIIWDKNNGGSDFADGELAWTSFKKPVRIFKWTWSGYIQQEMGDRKEQRIHPTQKPRQLYNWLLDNYAKEGDLILDTHLGSGSHAIACHERHFNLTAYEIDTDYYNAAYKRFKQVTAQTTIFDSNQL